MRESMNDQHGWIYRCAGDWQGVAPSVIVPDAMGIPAQMRTAAWLQAPNAPSAVNELELGAENGRSMALRSPHAALQTRKEPDSPRALSSVL
jgi:hypothetical protein